MGGGGDGGYGGGTTPPAGGVVPDAVRLASPSKGIDRRHRPSPCPSLTHAMPNNTEDSPTSSPATKRRQQLAESQIGTTLSARMAIASGSFPHVSAELLLQSEFVEALRFKNADLLYKLQVQSAVHVLAAFCLPPPHTHFRSHTFAHTHTHTHTHVRARAQQASRGNIMVAVRARPTTSAELAQGGKVTVEVVGDDELLCQDRRSDEWRSFRFDKVGAIILQSCRSSCPRCIRRLLL
jgi:hypothetical protein